MPTDQSSANVGRGELSPVMAMAGPARFSADLCAFQQGWRKVQGGRPTTKGPGGPHHCNTEWRARPQRNTNERPAVRNSLASSSTGVHRPPLVCWVFLSRMRRGKLSSTGWFMVHIWLFVINYWQVGFGPFKNKVFVCVSALCTRSSDVEQSGGVPIQPDPTRRET